MTPDFTKASVTCVCICIMHVCQRRTFHFSHVITLTVVTAFLSILAAHALHENLQLHYKTFCSALLATEKQHRTVTLSELQIQNSWGKLNARHLQNETENLLDLHSEPWYFEVSDLLIISPLQGSPSHRPSSPYMSQWGFVGAYLTFMKQTCTLQVPKRSLRKNTFGNSRNTEDAPPYFNQDNMPVFMKAPFCGI